MTMLVIFVFFIFFHFSFLSLSLPLDTTIAPERFQQLDPGDLAGSESIAFDPASHGLYTGVSDGRVLKWDNPLVIISGDRTGRLLKYDPRSKRLTVLLEGLVYPNGVAISKDDTFLLIVETTTQRILRFWLQGSKAEALEFFARLSRYPDNIKRNPKREFWVAIAIGSENLKNDALLYSHKRKSVLTSIWKSNTLKTTSINDVIGMCFNKKGEITEVLNDKFEKINSRLSEVGENNGSLWLESVVGPDVGIYKL